MRIHVRQLLFATGLTRVDDTSACNPPQDAPVEPTRPQIDQIMSFINSPGQRNILLLSKTVLKSGEIVLDTPIWPLYTTLAIAASGDAICTLTIE